MANLTFLIHTGKCSGPVVLDASKTTKLIAPSFSINSAGITNVTLDIQVLQNGGNSPSYWCSKCEEDIGTDDLGEDVSALCQVCGKYHTVSSLYVHSMITTICSGCKADIVDHLRNGKDISERTKEYITGFSLTENLRTVSLLKVLTSPVKI